MFIAGILYNPMLLFIALFVYLAGVQETRSVRLMESLRGIKIHEIMHEAYEVSPETPLVNLYGIPADFVVFEGNEPVGLVTWMDVLNGLKLGKRVCREVMREDVTVVSPEDDVGDVLPALRAEAIVYKDGVLYGVVDEGDMMRVLQYLSWRRFFNNLFRFPRG